jgi:hypothetical protein
MPNLTDAMEELRSLDAKSLEDGDKFTSFTNHGFSFAQALIRLYRSGDLIPLAHHNAMMAALVEKAADFVMAHGTFSHGRVSPLSEQSDPPLSKAAAAIVEANNERLRAEAGRFKLMAQAVASLTPADATAALAEAISRAREVKPLVWEEHGDVVKVAAAMGLHYTVWMSNRGGGRAELLSGWPRSGMMVLWRHDDPGADELGLMAAAQAHLTTTIHAALAPVEGAKA